MASSVFPTVTTGVTVSTATAGALSGDGSSGNKLAVTPDTTTIDVNGSDQLEAIGLTAGAILAGSVIGTEISAPSAPAANGYVLYAQDNGAGKTQLLVKFNTGAAQQLAIQP